MSNPNLKPGAAGKPAPRGLLKESTVSLEIRCAPRCTGGLKMFGHHFTGDATVLSLSDLGPQKARRLLCHPELAVKQLEAAPAAAKPKAAEKPAERKTITEYSKTDAPADDVKPRRRRRKAEE